MITWDVDNIKCGGCSNRIIQKLQTLTGVSGVSVDVDRGQVHFEAPEARLNEVEKVLAGLGYPRVGTAAGLAAVGADVRSVVSCVIGRLTGDDTKE